MIMTQIENMKHCIGFRGDKVKHRKYVAFRNHYITSDNSESWDDLVSKGLANKRSFPQGIGNNPRWYSVSEKGIEFLSKLLEVKITEMD